MKRVAIVQSNYIPWKGYFDLIESVDEFVLYDDAQYTKRDWRNRNIIKTHQGTQWLSIPVDVKGKFEQRICDTHVADTTWRRKHWSSIVGSYARAPYFAEIKQWLEPLYLGSDENSLSKINASFISAICRYLEIATPFRNSMELPLMGEGKTSRLLSLCKAVGATVYVSGPAAKGYLDEAPFHDAGIKVEWFDYGIYPEYPQLHPPFVHGVSIVDLLVSAGPSARQYMHSSRHPPHHHKTDEHADA